MASTTLYPPTLDSVAKAFIGGATSGFCRIYFTLSRASADISIIKGIHISVINQATGLSVIKKEDDIDNKRYRKSGIIIQNVDVLKKSKNREDTYYVDIDYKDIENGWTQGNIYKIQIRFSEIGFPGGDTKQLAWMTKYGSKFSEWSTFCTTKAISGPIIDVAGFNSFKAVSDNENSEIVYTICTSTLVFDAEYNNMNNKDGENLYSYDLRLYNEDDELLESSGLICTSKYYKQNNMHYTFKHIMKDQHNYSIKLHYITTNRYEKTIRINFYVSLQIEEKINAIPVTIDYLKTIKDEEYVQNFLNLTSYPLEVEEGRIGIKLYSSDKEPFQGNLCIKRADSKDNFNTWVDLKIIPCDAIAINDLPMIFDYTAESGVWYKYGVEQILTGDRRSVINYIEDNVVLREFEFSYLLGEGGKQLKLNLTPGVSSYSYTVSDSKVDTIGGKYPFITRNGNVKYRTFPLSGIISFNMDEQNTFSSDKDLYKYNNVVKLYRERRKKEQINLYDYKREYDFREKVIDFLQDGKPKLFKSSTEGNIIVRLMNVTTTPQATLNRMIYNFSCNAFEVADATVDNYIKYGLFEVGKTQDNFIHGVIKIGQIDLDFSPGEDIMARIWEKYDRSNFNTAGQAISLQKVFNVDVEIVGKSLAIYNKANEEVVGNNIEVQGTMITLYDNEIRYYHIDDSIEFTNGAGLKILGGREDLYGSSLGGPIHATVNFLYQVSSGPYIGKIIKEKRYWHNMGQYFNHVEPGHGIFKDIYYQYYIENDEMFRKLNNMTWCCLEANPGAIFEIVDDSDNKKEPQSTRLHEINYTGTLNLSDINIIRDIRYVGMRNRETGEIDTTKGCDVIIDYIYFLTMGTYM